MRNNFLLFLIPGVLLAWGFSWPVMKLSLIDIPPIWLGALRMFIGGVLLFLVVLIKKEKIMPAKRDWAMIIVVSMLQMSLFNMLLNVGLEKVEASHGVILVFTTPLWITPISIIFFKEKLHFLTVLGLLFGFIGVLLILNPLSLDWRNTQLLLGNACLIMTAVCWAASILYVNLKKNTSSPLILAPWQMFLSAIFLSVVASLLEPNPVIHWNYHLAMLMIYLGPIATAFGYWGVIEMTRQMNPVTLSLTMLGVPIIGFISSAYFLGESLTLIKLIALSSLLLGLICVGLGKKYQKKTRNIYENEPI